MKVWVVFKSGERTLPLACWLNDLPALVEVMAMDGYVMSTIKQWDEK